LRPGDDSLEVGIHAGCSKLGALLALFIANSFLFFFVLVVLGAGALTIPLGLGQLVGFCDDTTPS
jgi:hypothetical protein